VRKKFSEVDNSESALASASIFFPNKIKHSLGGEAEVILFGHCVRQQWIF
jgi:hypothetical protein